jgi:hypothetical protein
MTVAPDSQSAGGDPFALIGKVTGHRYFSGTGDHFPIILQLKPEGARAALKALSRRKGWTIPPVYLDAPEAFPNSAAFATAMLNRVAYEALERGQVKSVRAWSLQLPVRPDRPRPTGFMVLPTRRPGIVVKPKGAQPQSLFGVIDCGCPFARADLLRESGSRVVALWDQDSHPVFSELSDDDVCRASHPPSLGYGGEVNGAQLEDWCNTYRDASGAVDEAACYRAAGYRLLEGQFQHGAAILGILAGPSTVVRRHPADPDDLPEWNTEARTNAANAGIVFVQLSSDSVQDSSSASLPRSVLDGLRYIVAVARGQGCQRLVINVSDGTSRCAHDGRSIIEQAMQALVADLQAQKPPIDLDLVLAAGNAFAEMRHATLEVADPKQPPAQVTLRLPPGNEAASFVTVAVPGGTRDLQLALRPPGVDTPAEPWVDIGSDDAGTLRCWPDEAHAVAWVASLRPAEGESRIVALSWAPTVSVDASEVSAPVGDWVIAVRRKPDSPDNGTVNVDAWISRGQTNAGALERARQLVFVDADDTYDPCRGSRSCEDDPLPPRSPIRRQGTLNGLATLAVQGGVTVVGSRTIRENRLSLYSSEGPLPARPQGPDRWAPTDHSRTLSGVRTTGVFSGSVVRVEGTSFAAPQVARDLMNASSEPLLKTRPERRRPCRDEQP